MQIKFFTIPIFGGEAQEEELNKFLRSHKVLQTKCELVQEGSGSAWCCVVKYTLGPGKSSNERQPKVDYKTVLNPEVFQRFSALRAVRKQIAEREAIPAYAVFTNAELAGIAKLEGELTLNSLLQVENVGQKKVEKYGAEMIQVLQADEKSE